MQELSWFNLAYGTRANKTHERAWRSRVSLRLRQVRWCPVIIAVNGEPLNAYFRPARLYLS
jgi:hypothetical protein